MTQRSFVLKILRYRSFQSLVARQLLAPLVTNPAGVSRVHHMSSSSSAPPTGSELDTSASPNGPSDPSSTQEISPALMREYKEVLSFLEQFRQDSSPKTLEKILYVDTIVLPQHQEERSPPQLKRRSMHDLNDPAIVLTDYIAVDCEMVGLQDGQALARVSAVNELGVVVYDAFVQPPSRVTDWRTRYSGISPAIMKEARKHGELVTFTQAQLDLQGILTGRTVVGHAVANDLKALELEHPRHRTVDTQKLPLFGKQGNGLKKLLQKHYGIAIQTSKKGHSPIEDARASMLLFRTFQSDFVRLQRQGVSEEAFQRGVTERINTKEELPTEVKKLTGPEIRRRTDKIMESLIAGPIRLQSRPMRSGGKKSPVSAERISNLNLNEEQELTKEQKEELKRKQKKDKRKQRKLEFKRKLNEEHKQMQEQGLDPKQEQNPKLESHQGPSLELDREPKENSKGEPRQGLKQKPKKVWKKGRSHKVSENAMKSEKSSTS